MGRYTGSPDTLVFDQRIDLRGFSPPTDHTLHLLHYEADQLCVWKPGEHQLDQLQIRYTYVSTEGPAYKEHFGSKEHILSLAESQSYSRVVGSRQVPLHES